MHQRNRCRTSSLVRAYRLIHNFIGFFLIRHRDHNDPNILRISSHNNSGKRYLRYHPIDNPVGT